MEEEEINIEEVRRQRGCMGEEEPNAKQIYQVKRIVIDAGHGGMDGGALGYAGKLKEKDVALDIARRVARILSGNRSLNVLMTRKSDHYISLKYRTDFANARNADLFVSIHCNSNPHSLATGTETYVYSSKASNKVAAVAAVRENAGEDTSNILSALTHRIYNGLSFLLAQEVERRIRDRLGLSIRRVQQAPFYVLARVDMPSILIETAFLSNRSEETKMADPAWRDKIAQAIADGIFAYKERVEASIENREARR